MAQAENLDSRLMTLEPEQEGDAAGELRRQQRGPSASPGQAEEGQTDGQLADWRQRVQEERRKLDVKERVKQRLEQTVTAPVRIASSWLLQVAWGMMLGFITFIPGVFLADLHVMGNLTLGKKFFCDLGEEWLGAKTINSVWLAKLFKKFGEKMLLAIANAIAFFVIIAILALLVWLADNLVLKAVYQAGRVVSWTWELVTGK